MPPHRLLCGMLIASSIGLSAIGQLCMKAGMHALANSDSWQTLSESLTQPFLWWTMAGLFCYGLSLLAWLVVLTRNPLSLAYPLLSVSYILVYIGASFWPTLMESPNALRTAGTVLIAAGVAIVSGTGRKRHSSHRPATPKTPKEIRQI